jgi:D-alanine-D-alanine ligase
MTNPVKVLLLYGGKSGEHEISLRSAASVFAQLDSKKYTIIPVAMDKNGQFFLHQPEHLVEYTDALPVTTKHSVLLPSLLANGGLAIEADVVFPVVHGPLYEDGALQGLLQLADVAYVGSHVLSSAMGMDKDISRRIACVDGLISARYRCLSWHSSAEQKHQFCKEVSQAFGWPLFVKPCSLGSSVGIHKVHNASELAHAIEDALRYDEVVMVEEMVHGLEIELAVLENACPSEKPHVSVAGEIKVHHSDGFYSYTAKYLDSDKTELIIPAQLDEALHARLKTYAADVFTRLKCKGMARVDFFVNTNTSTIIFNEINTLPGFTTISMYPKLWQASGVTYKELLDALIESAITHQRCRQQLVTNYL